MLGMVKGDIRPFLSIIWGHRENSREQRASFALFLFFETKLTVKGAFYYVVCEAFVRLASLCLVRP